MENLLQQKNEELNKQQNELANLFASILMIEDDIDKVRDNPACYKKIKEFSDQAKNRLITKIEEVEVVIERLEDEIHIIKNTMNIIEKG